MALGKTTWPQDKLTPHCPAGWQRLPCVSTTKVGDAGTLSPMCSTRRTRLTYCVMQGRSGPGTTVPHAFLFPRLLSMQVQTALPQFLT